MSVKETAEKYVRCPSLTSPLGAFRQTASRRLWPMESCAGKELIMVSHFFCIR